MGKSQNPLGCGHNLRRVKEKYTTFITHHCLFFSWTLETFKLGYTRDIRENDLYAPLPEHQSDILGKAA